MRAMALASAVAAACALPAAAQRLDPPAGCTAFLTVQSKGCAVAHYWRCEQGPEGASWAASYDEDGPVSLSLYDREFQWLDSQYVADASREYLVAPAEDPASLSALLETGHDTYDFTIREESVRGVTDVRHVGYDELTGRTVTIDGVTLLETVFASTATNAETGDEIYSVVGQQYVHPEERLFFLGRDSFSQNGRTTTSDGSPLRFHFPGDPGFGRMTPAFECGEPTDIVHRRRP